MEWRLPSQTCWDEWRHEENTHLSQGAILFGAIWPAPSGQKASRWNNSAPLEEQEAPHLRCVLPGHLCPLTLSPCHQGGVAALAEERKVAKYVNLTPEHLFSLIADGPRTKALLRDLGCQVTQTKGGDSYHLPWLEAVHGSAAGQLWLSDGHHRPTWFWPFLLTKLPTQNVISSVYIPTIGWKILDPLKLI